MHWNLRYSNDKELSIDADFTPDESFEGIADRVKKMRQNQSLPNCPSCEGTGKYVRTILHGRDCINCNGTGKITDPCVNCLGRGCKECNQQGTREANDDYWKDLMDE